MAASYKATCIVLKKTKLGESDLILTMLSEDGTQVKGVAKGARKPGNKRFGARLEPYSVVDLQLYPGKSLDTITECRCVLSNAACREELGRSAACGFAAELVAKVIADGEVGERMFPMLKAALAVIGDSRPQRALLIALAFQWKAVSLLGFRPAIRECAYCGSPVEGVGCFDVTAGGCLCDSCSQGIRSSTDPALASWVDLLIRSTFKELQHVQDPPLLPLLDLVEMWIREHMGLILKSTGFLRMCLADAV